MGRMLETLRQGKTGAAPASEEKPVAPLRAVPPEPAQDNDFDETVPYIEVGGPRKVIDASPDVLAVAVPAYRGPTPVIAPMPMVEVKPTPPPERPAPSTDGGPWTVQFRPLSREALPSSRVMRRLSPELIAHHQPDHAVAQQYRTLLNSLLVQCPSGFGQVLLFTSPAPWGGTTTVLLNLAITAARHEGRRVAVVDANQRRPALADRLGLGPAPGLREVLGGSVPLAQAMQETAQKNLWALPAGRTSNDSRLPLDWLMPTLRQLRQQFELVFVDAASWNEGSEVSALAATCDSVYMVMQEMANTGTDGVGPLPLLRQPPTNLQGCILTMR